MGASGNACADDTRAKTKATVIILIMRDILLSVRFSLEFAAEDDWPAIGLRGTMSALILYGLAAVVLLVFAWILVN